MMRRLLWRLGAGLVLSAAVAALGPTSAGGYVRYRTKSGNPYAWGVASVQVVGYSRGIATMTVDEITSAMTASVSAWSNQDPLNACSFLSLTLAMRPQTEVPPEAAHDEKNVIALRDGCWTCICSMTKDGGLDCHERGELALTTIWSRPCGEIVEADVEVNAETSATGSNFMWADLDDATGPNRSSLHDLQNALTHEMGHFIGLDHTCILGNDPVDEKGNVVHSYDNLGDVVPHCSGGMLSPSILESTMYPSADSGTIDKRSLADDDRQGLCAIYPLGTTPMSCGSSQGGGCSVADGAPAEGESAGRTSPVTMWTWLGCAVTAMAGGLAAARRRRRARATSSHRG
jgi:hypothetical protein